MTERPFELSAVHGVRARLIVPTVRLKLASILMALCCIFGETADATILTFARTETGTVPENNLDITVSYGSNATAVNLIGAIDGGEGFTPNIALLWAPTGGGDIDFIPNGNILEFHSAATFVSAPPAGGAPNPGPGFTVPVLQLDWDLSGHQPTLPAAPTIDFIPDPGWAVKIHELRIGNANDQLPVEPVHPWTLSVLELPSLTFVAGYTTAALSAGSAEIAILDFTGLPGVSYRLRLDDGGSLPPGSNRHPRTAIDNLRFSQVVAGGESMFANGFE